MWFGGSCFPKDVKALNSLSKNLNLESLILDSVLKINDNQPFEIINILKGYFDNLKNKSFLILGLSFKPNTDDVRDSISLKVIDFLQKKSAIYLLTTQLLLRMLKNSLQILKIYFLQKNWENELEKVDGILILTEWIEYNKLADAEFRDKVVEK